MVVAAQPMVGSPLAQPSAGDTQEDLGAQDVADVRETSTTPDQPSIIGPTDQLAACQGYRCK